ncbi:MAG TPA: sigma 54-interacting transcriptional regulator [bacterium]|nr:sigma 54-interacting transcriptional regulator [bacterium]
MSGATDSPDRLQALRAQVETATTPAERVKATLSLAEDLWLRDAAAAIPLLEQVAAEAEEAGEVKCGVRAASMLSELFRRAGDLDGSMRQADLVLSAADAIGDRRIRASGLNLVGMIHQERGELQRALECFDEFLQVSRETGFDQGERSALNQLAGVHGLRGELDEALACYRQCLELSSKAGDPLGRAIYAHNVGWTLEDMGRWAEATEYFHRSIALSEEHGFHDLLLSARMQLGELSAKRSDCENATLMFSAVIDAERERRHSGQQLREALSNLGWVYFRSGDLARAEEKLAEVARLSESAGDRCVLATICRRRAEVALAQGRLAAAGELLAQAAHHATDLNLRKEQGQVLRVEAGLAAARHDTAPALDLFARSEAVLEPLGDTFDLALTRLLRGSLLVDLGREGEAQTMLQTAARTFRRLGVVAEAEEAGRLLYRLEMRADSNAALAQGLAGLAALDLTPEQFIERALLILCDNLRFEQGAVLVRGRPVALRGQPDLSGLSGRRAALSQTDVELLLPVRQDRRLLGILWLGRSVPLPARMEPDLIDAVSRALAPQFIRLRELGSESNPASEIPGLRFRGVIGRNRDVLDMLADVARFAATDVPVLIRGESGTGKELVARALHESGPRADRPFITVNCAAVPESLLEAEFFGVEEGAATGVAARPGKFELAHTGTIFLDEIGDMSSTLQSKLLRVIEDKTVTRVGGAKAILVDARVVAATNMDLEARVRERQFRSDLLYRLNTVMHTIPPLRRRREDLPALTEYFIVRTAQHYGRPARRAGNEVLAVFAEAPWPGNIRQLKHVIERAVILARGETLEIADLPPEFRQGHPAFPVRSTASVRGERRRAADEAERAALLDAMGRANGYAPAAAKLAGYSRTYFYRLLRKHHIAG